MILRTWCHPSCRSSFRWPAVTVFTCMCSVTWLRETQVLAKGGTSRLQDWPCTHKGFHDEPLHRAAMFERFQMLLLCAAARSGVNRYMIALLLQFIVAEKKLDVLQARALQECFCTVEVMCMYLAFRLAWLHNAGRRSLSPFLVCCRGRGPSRANLRWTC